MKEVGRWWEQLSREWSAGAAHPHLEEGSESVTSLLSGSREQLTEWEALQPKGSHLDRESRLLNEISWMVWKRGASIEK